MYHLKKIEHDARRAATYSGDSHHKFLLGHMIVFRMHINKVIFDLDNYSDQSHGSYGDSDQRGSHAYLLLGEGYVQQWTTNDYDNNNLRLGTIFFVNYIVK